MISSGLAFAARRFRSGPVIARARIGAQLGRWHAPTAFALRFPASTPCRPHEPLVFAVLLGSHGRRSSDIRRTRKRREEIGPARSGSYDAMAVKDYECEEASTRAVRSGCRCCVQLWTVDWVMVM